MSNKQRFASVWDALEDNPVRAENLKLRGSLMNAISEKIELGGLTQPVAA